MAIKYTIEEHAVGTVVKALAQNGGKHIYNITLTEDVDNGYFVGKGDFVELDRYTEAEPGECAGTVVAEAANGNYYVEITSADEGTLFVATTPINAEEFTEAFKKESAFYNASGDVARAYQLAPGDVVEISGDGFAATPTAGDSVTLQAVTGLTAKQFG